MDNYNDTRIQEILEKSFLSELLKDDGITDISFNGTDLWLQHNQRGKYKAEINPSIDEVRQLMKNIADKQKKEITNSDPILDTEIGYLRVNAMHNVVSPDGMSFSVRISRPKLAMPDIKELTTKKREEVADLLKVLMVAGSNIVISGKTGTGKTELLKSLAGHITGKILLIEDTRDSHLKQLYPDKDITSWQTVKHDDPNKSIDMGQLGRSGLRNNPDWEIFAETRGVEAADMFDAVKTDHYVITTLHAKGAMKIPARLIPMIRQSKAYSAVSEQLIGTELTELFRFGIHLSIESKDGKLVRKIKEIVEFTDFTPKGAVGTYLYKEGKNYENGSYVPYDKFGTLSQVTLDELMDKELYHLIPDVFISKDK